MAGAGSPIRLLLVDDHLAFRIPFAYVLEREADLTVVAQADSLAEVRALLPDFAERIDVAPSSISIFPTVLGWRSCARAIRRTL